MIAGSLQPPAPLRAASLLDGAQLSPTTSEMHGHSPTDVMFRKKEQKDAELDKKIEALRKKNEALMKRYQEVEEDKKRAEEEGMAPLSRKGKAEDLTITINKSASESRVVTKKAGSGDVASARGVQDPADPDVNLFGAGRGRRRQLLVTMSGITKGKRIVSEKRGQTLPPSPGAAGDVDEEEDAERGTMGRPPQPPKPDGGPQEDDGGRQERPGPTEESLWLAECDPYYQETEGPVPQGHTDLTVPTSREEQLEYMRWKKERERIDRERVARHRNAKGQWKRAWDVDKTENMFRDRFHRESDRGNKTRGGRSARRGQSRATGESQGHPYQNPDKGGKNLPTVSSKAKGKDRLTGRARRWDAKEEDGCLQIMETSLEEFLEELDSIIGPEVDSSPKPTAESRVDEVGKDSLACAVGADEAGPDVRADDAERSRAPPSEPDCSQREEASAVGAGASQGERALKSRRVSEKKVRFSEETIKETEEAERGAPGPAPFESEGAPGPAPFESEVTSAVTGSSRGPAPCAAAAEEAERTLASDPTGPEGDGVQRREQEAPDLPHSGDPVLGDGDANGQGPEDTSRTETSGKEQDDAQGLTPEPETGRRTADGNSAALPEENTHQPLKNSKNTRSPEEMISSSLSVISLDSGAPRPYHETSNAKVKENGKIV